MSSQFEIKFQSGQLLYRPALFVNHSLQIPSLHKSVNYVFANGMLIRSIIQSLQILMIIKGFPHFKIKTLGKSYEFFNFIENCMHDNLKYLHGM